MASVRRCIDCDVVLVDEVDPDAQPAATVKSAAVGDQIGYELAGWGNQLKVTLEGMLDRAGIRRVWESGALVVPAADEELVDELVATVEGGEVVELDTEASQILFEIQGLDADELADLDARLIAAHLPHAWDEEGSLLVAEADEETAAAMIDEVLAGPRADEPDGLATHQALSRLYVAVDKLVKDPVDAKLAARYRDAAEGIADLSVPYGLSGQEWTDLTSAATELAELAGPPPADDDGSDGGEVEAADEDHDEDETEAVVDDEVEDAAEATESDQDEGDDADADDADGGEPDRRSAARDAAVTLRNRLRELV